MWAVLRRGWAGEPHPLFGEPPGHVVQRQHIWSTSQSLWRNYWALDRNSTGLLIWELLCVHERRHSKALTSW